MSSAEKLDLVYIHDKYKQIKTNHMTQFQSTIL